MTGMVLLLVLLGGLVTVAVMAGQASKRRELVKRESELEPVKRGIYGGACGYISYAGDMDVAIAIRAGVVKDKVLHVQAAAGVVADSVSELEWKETEAKARALLRAAELVEEGLE